MLDAWITKYWEDVFVGTLAHIGRGWGDRWRDADRY